jgi:threonine synthase
MLICSGCSYEFPDSEPRWRCDRCGERLRYEGGTMFSPADLRGRPTTLWRYHETLGLDDPANCVTLGEGLTPLVPFRLSGQRVLLKLDFLCPTGSYKDRGSTVMLSKLREWGVGDIVEDSSGNAGASVAAYGAAAGIRTHIYVPASTSAGKAAQISMYGADLVRVPGSREDTASAAWEAAGRIFYGSHNYSPHFLLGMKTVAYEIAEQLDWQAPDWVVAPAGNGGLFVGIHLGFRDLVSRGIVARMPRLAAVQAERCDPILRAWNAGLDEVPGIAKQDTAAEGISVAKPARGSDVLRAVRESNGLVRTVGEDALWKMLGVLGAGGVYVEPTSAVAPAAAAAMAAEGIIQPADRVVVTLTGFGLKATDKIVAHSTS